ncbi:uncharacterized protein LOC123317638 [Coccinella septempunctata]|uniref:uncharacterized protein LOC123317638 n=1 Tax=Coccinella septempunctata TaxID=41139 RepID=UPI001D086821|nr:uncharacterized protein LOC123317638 [Coccinella septempunctata]
MNQGGRGQRAGPLRSRPEVEPDGVSCGASGAAPRDGTVRPNSNPHRRERRSISLDGTRSRPAEAPVSRDGRVRWSQEENILLMRTHFIAQQLQQDTGRTYREILTTTWNEINPWRPSYPNLLANRIRQMLENEKFSSVELEDIRKSTRPYTPIPADDDNPSNEEIHLEPQIQPTNQNNKTSRLFEKNMKMYSRVSPQKRPRIPRLKGSKKILESVERTNMAMKAHITDNCAIEDLIDCVYAGAITVCEENGIQLCCEESRPKEERTPPWRIRLERKIISIRRTIGTIHTYLNNSQPTKKICKKVSRIASEHHIKGRKENLPQQLVILSDTLKQKIKALGNRIRRYNERVRRYRNNQLYYKNTKQFYRSLDGTTTDNKTNPTPERMHATWKEIWGHAGDHDDEAFWIREAETESHKYTMEQVIITKEDIKTVLKKTNNWSAPGTDGIHNYWWKYFNSTHDSLAKLFQEALKNPSIIPDSCTLGITYMLPKGTDNEDPRNYRPITCLPTIYKILTGVLTQKLWQHVGKYNMAREQNGCRRDAKGCKDLLIADTIITKQARKKQRSLSMAWIDYKKAYDSIPHSWLKKVLKLYGVSETVINLLEHLMQTWRTKLSVDTNKGNYTTEEIRIQRGIFQGDKLSTLWFCLSINLLSKLLNQSKYGYVIERRNNTKINHQLYIDDLKLYAANEDQLTRELKIVASFTDAIKMEMGLDKCAVVHMRRGKIREGEALEIQEQLTIRTLGPEETYKYLGIQQGLEINTNEAKTTFKHKFFDRLKKILQSKLNSKAMFTSISTWVVHTPLE